jgi:hypothetical protein
MLLVENFYITRIFPSVSGSRRLAVESVEIDMVFMYQIFVVIVSVRVDFYTASLFWNIWKYKIINHIWNIWKYKIINNIGINNIVLVLCHYSLFNSLPNSPCMTYKCLGHFQHVSTLIRDFLNTKFRSINLINTVYLV